MLQEDQSVDMEETDWLNEAAVVHAQNTGFDYAGIAQDEYHL